MKPRRVIITIEMESERTVREITDGIKINSHLWFGTIKQVQVNVIKIGKK